MTHVIVINCCGWEDGTLRADRMFWRLFNCCWAELERDPGGGEGKGREGEKDYGSMVYIHVQCYTSSFLPQML